MYIIVCFYIFIVVLFFAEKNMLMIYIHTDVHLDMLIVNDMCVNGFYF